MLLHCATEIGNNDASQALSAQQSQFLRGRCIVCNESEAELCIIPCFDFCVCEKCWEVLKQDDPLQCPACNCIATEAKKMKFNF